MALETQGTVPRARAADVLGSLVELVAERAAAIVLEQLPIGSPSSPYLNVDEAADYLRCERQRIYDLLSARRLTKLKDGSRVLLLRSELGERERTQDQMLATDALKFTLEGIKRVLLRCEPASLNAPGAATAGSEPVRPQPLAVAPPCS